MPSCGDARFLRESKTQHGGHARKLWGTGRRALGDAIEQVVQHFVVLGTREGDRIIETETG